MEIKVYAKINAALNIIGIENNMHLLESVMASVSLFDLVSVEETGGEITAACDVPISGKNIALTAAERVYSVTGRKLKVYIKKGIPLGGGLGGSSADGAAVIIAAQKLFGLDRTTALEIAASLGADVPFMTDGGFAVARGYGEKLEYFDCAANIKLLIAECGSVSTAECYKLSDTLTLPRADIPAVVEGLRRGTLSGTNALLPAARLLLPRIAAAEAIAGTHGVAAHLTGSGGCLFMSYDNKIKASLERGGFKCHIAGFTGRGYDIL